MADLAAALVAAEARVGGGTHENDARVWSRYTKYCNSIGLNGNYFLDEMPRQHRIATMGAFAVAIHEGRFSRPGDGPLAKKSVEGTINAVATTFQENGQEDPHRDADHHVGQLLQRQLRSYAKDNPKEIQQKAFPVCIYRIILSSPATELHSAIGKLAAAVHFWVMQSCEYSKVLRAEQRQTKQLCLRNIVFIKGGNILNHTSAELNLADYVSITFERQKNDRKSDTVTQWKTSDTACAQSSFRPLLSNRSLHTKEPIKTLPSPLPYTGTVLSASHWRWSQVYSKMALSLSAKRS